MKKKNDKEMAKWIKKAKESVLKRVGYDKELSLAKENEAYHRKLMEYHQEQIKILKEELR